MGFDKTEVPMTVPGFRGLGAMGARSLKESTTKNLITLGTRWGKIGKLKAA